MCLFLGGSRYRWLTVPMDWHHAKAQTLNVQIFGLQDIPVYLQGAYNGSSITPCSAYLDAGLVVASEATLTRAPGVYCEP